MEAEFRQGRFETGAVTGVDAVSRELAKFFPKHGTNPNELPDAPVMICAVTLRP